MYPSFDRRLGVYSANDAVEATLTGKPYPIKGVLIQGVNPVVTLANAKRLEQALQKLDFLVVADLFMTPTAQLADVVLPAASCFEETTLPSRIHMMHYILLQQRAIELEECWPDSKILLELAKELGYGEYFPWSNFEEMIDAKLAPSGITTKQLQDKGTGIAFERQYRKYEKSGFSTPSGKVELYAQTLEKAGHDPLPTYVEPKESPFSRPDIAPNYPLIASAGPKKICYTHSQDRNIPGLRRIVPEPLVHLHPDDAAQRQINDLDPVIVIHPEEKSQSGRGLMTNCLGESFT